MKLFAGVSRLWRLLKTYEHGQFPNHDGLAEELKVPVGTVRRWLRELTRRGCVKVYQNGPNSAFYSLVSEPRRIDFVSSRIQDAGRIA